MNKAKKTDISLSEFLKNSGSTKHHYIPQFYLKGFCRNDGKFDVYDKKYKKFKPSPQSPAIIFFEPRRNNIIHHGQRTNIIERIYSRMEDPLSKLFDLIRSGAASDTILQPVGIGLLKIHMALQFWRLPQLDKFADAYLRSLSLEQVKYFCTISVPPMPAQKIYIRLQTDSGFRKYARSFLLPLTTFDLNNSLPEDMEWKILDVEPEKKWSNHLCTDAPFIFEDPQSLMHFTEPFVFPLTNSRLLVARRRTVPFDSLDPIISTKISLLSYIQAHRYVVTGSQEYLEKIIDFSETYTDWNAVLQLQREILDTL